MTVNELYSVFDKNFMEVEYRTEDNYFICRTNYFNTRKQFGTYQIESVMVSMNGYLIILLKDWRKKMSRLIDADELKRAFIGNRYGTKAIEYVIDNVPTVNAIPIEWIEEWQNRHELKYDSYFTMRDGKPKYAIECMIEDWEKENGQKTSD